MYRLTAGGRKRLAGQAAAWRSVVGAIERILQGANDGKPAVT